MSMQDQGEPEWVENGWAYLTDCYFKQRPDLLQQLRQCTVDLMAAPRLRCRRRTCRRSGGCSFVRSEDHSPSCLRNFSPEERAGYQLLLDRAMRHCVEKAMPARPPRTEIDHALLELERGILQAGDPRIAVLRAFWRGQSAAGGRKSKGSPAPRDGSLCE